MGTDISPLDVEESTEPPICASTEEQHSQQIKPGDVNLHHDPEKTGELSLSAKPKFDRQGYPGEFPQHDIGTVSHHAHTFDSAQLATLLGVDIEYVHFTLSTYTSFCLCG